MGGATLDEALTGARAADRLTRIEWRDPIAAHGRDAIEAVLPWIGDPELSRFAVRVIEHTAKFGDEDAAVAALASAQRSAASPDVRDDISQALARLRPAAARTSTPGKWRARIPERAGWEWPGFAPTDFGRVEGTSWRRSQDPVGMIPLLLRPLQEIDSAFASFAIYMSPEVHLADRDRYHEGDEWGQGWRASKLVVYAHGPTVERPSDPAKVAAGWYIEKGTGEDEFGPVDAATWDWPLFLDLLRDPVRRFPLEQATARHSLRTGDYRGGRFTVTGAVCGFAGTLEDGDLVLRDGAGLEVGRGWDDLLAKLTALPSGSWHDFHIWREWTAAEAVDAGQPFASGALQPVLVDLARIYFDMIRWA